MIAFIDEHRDDYGVEPTCRVLPIAVPTTSMSRSDVILHGYRAALGVIRC